MTRTPSLVGLKSLPVVRTLLARRYERYFRSAVDCHLFCGVFDSFAAAEGFIRREHVSGYDQTGAASMYADELGELRHTDYPALFWLQQVLPETRHLVDFGGHVGLKYYAFDEYLTFPDTLRWTVCDVPAVVEAGAELAAQERVTALQFATDFDVVSGSDVLFCSGSLQYVEASLASMLERIAHKPKHVIINSTPMTDRAEFFTINNIGTAFCPYKIQNDAHFVSAMQRVGYDVVDRWENHGKTCTIPYHASHDVLHYSGFYLQRSDSRVNTPLGSAHAVATARE
jgi:putative methyltransferase (TIGR04325 family)